MRKVMVRGHTRRWPKRWDLRRFIAIVGEKVFVVKARSKHDAEQLFKRDKHVTILNFEVESFFGLFPSTEVCRFEAKEA